MGFEQLSFKTGLLNFTVATLRKLQNPLGCTVQEIFNYILNNFILTNQNPLLSFVLFMSLIQSLELGVKYNILVQHFPARYLTISQYNKLINSKEQEQLTNIIPKNKKKKCTKVFNKLKKVPKTKIFLKRNESYDSEPYDL